MEEIFESDQAPLAIFEGDIICRRDPFYINIPQTIKYHSPTGLEWGYGGSGPADLALNILILFISPTRAMQFHQEFKWQFVSTLPYEGGIITNETIKAWLEARGLM